MAEDDKKLAKYAEPEIEVASELLKHYVYKGKGGRAVDLSLTTVQDMTPAAAEAVQKVAENTYAVPAREETKREWLSTAKHYGTLVAVVVIVIVALPKLTDPWAIAAMVLAVVVIYGILRVIKAVKGGE